jgi:hypothetical protein
MNCPACKNPINSKSNLCEWCGSNINIDENIDQDQNRKSELEKKIIELCKKGNKLAALKLKKDNSSLDLKECRRYIEDLCIREQIKPKSGCFIATACYGNYDAPEVIRFRSFRDEFLEKHYLGRKFITFYYYLSPTIARFLEKSNFSKKVIKIVLLKPLLKILDLKNR